jgi:hypothetical protein
MDRCCIGEESPTIGQQLEDLYVPPPTIENQLIIIRWKKKQQTISCECFFESKFSLFDQLTSLAQHVI